MSGDGKQAVKHKDVAGACSVHHLKRQNVVLFGVDGRMYSSAWSPGLLQVPQHGDI